jgi:hypothetical protein
VSREPGAVQKLRKVKDHPEAFQLDERGSLYEHYLRFVATLRPVAILMENVPDILNYGGRNIAEEISENLEELGYSVAYTLLNAAAYGVPQTRERFFLMAWHSQVSILPPSFPPPSRHVKEMPVGYKGTRAAASRLSAENRAILPGFRRPNRYVDVGALPSSDLQGPVTAFEAIGDLPRITGHLDGSIRRGPRRFNILVVACAYFLVCLIGHHIEGKGLDRLYKANTVRTRTHSAFQMGWKGHALVRWLPLVWLRHFATLAFGLDFPEQTLPSGGAA